MMRQRAFSLIVLVLTSTVLLESCGSQKVVVEQSLSNSPITLQLKPSPLPLQVKTSLARYKPYNDAEELETAAELIVVGRPLLCLEDTQPTSIPESEKAKKQPIFYESVVVKDDQGFIVDRYSIAFVTVEKVLKGKVEEKQIQVLQPAAIVKESNQPPFISQAKDYSLLKRNTKYLLFLKEVDTATYPNLAGVYRILSVNQGKFNLDKTDDEETGVEERNEQYRQLKAKVRKKYETQVNAVP